MANKKRRGARPGSGPEPRRGQRVRRLAMWLFVVLVVGLFVFAGVTSDSDMTCGADWAPGLGRTFAH